VRRFCQRGPIWFITQPKAILLSGSQNPRHPLVPKWPNAAWPERPFRLGELEAQAEPGRPAQYQVLAVHLLDCGSGQGGSVCDGGSVQDPAGGERGIDAGDAAGGAMSIGGRPPRSARQES